MRVQVTFPGGSRAYTYEWPSVRPLKLGDKVVTPPNWANNDYQFAEVTSLTSDYKGTVVELIGLVNKSNGQVYYPKGEP
jgi:hypothetical protein